MVCQFASLPPSFLLSFYHPFFSRVWGDKNVIQMSKRPVSLSPSRPLPHLSVFLCPFLVRRSYCSPGCSFIERDIAERGKKRKRWHAFSACCSASPARVACHLSDRGLTASTVEGTPLRHNGTDWAATDLPVCLSVKPVHQLSVTRTCLSALYSGLAFWLSCSQHRINSISNTVYIFLFICGSVLIFFDCKKYSLAGHCTVSAVDLCRPPSFLWSFFSLSLHLSRISLSRHTFPSLTVCIPPSSSQIRCQITPLMASWLLWHFSIYRHSHCTLLYMTYTIITNKMHTPSSCSQEQCTFTSV